LWIEDKWKKQIKDKCFVITGHKTNLFTLHLNKREEKYRSNRII
jgi:hypothetical protein